MFTPIRFSQSYTFNWTIQFCSASVHSAQNVVHAFEWHGFFCVCVYIVCTVWQMSSRQYAHVKWTMENRIELIKLYWRLKTPTTVARSFFFIHYSILFQCHCGGKHTKKTITSSNQPNGNKHTKKTKKQLTSSTLHHFFFSADCGCLLRVIKLIIAPMANRQFTQCNMPFGCCESWPCPGSQLNKLTAVQLLTGFNVKTKNESDHIQMIHFETEWMGFD